MGSAASSISDRAEAERCPDAAQKRADTCDWNAPDLDLMPLPAPGMRTSPGALAIRQRGNQRVMKSRREQGHRGRQTVRLEAVGNRDRQQIW